MTDIIKPELCVIGAGGGGGKLALAAAASGKRTVLVEGNAPQALSGRQFAHALFSIAGHIAAMRELARDGILATGPEFRFRAAIRQAARVAGPEAGHVPLERLVAQGAHVVRAGGRFIDRRSFEIESRLIRPRRFVIAGTGQPALPAIDGLADAGPLLPPDLPLLERKPAHLVIVADDVMGLTLAQAFLRLGSRVTLCCVGEAIPGCDPELTGFLIRRLLLEGLTIHRKADIVRLERHAKPGIRLVRLENGHEIATDATDLLIVPAGRADLDLLQPQKAGIRLGGTGAVEVSKGLISSNTIVHAMGGALGVTDPDLIQRHVDILAGQLSGRGHSRLDPLPFVVRSDPEIAWVGMTEAEARRAGGPIRLLRFPYSQLARAAYEAAGPGLVKVVTDRKGKVLGAGIAGRAAAGQIALWAYAMGRSLSVDDLADLPASADSFMLGAREVARSFRGSGTLPSPLRRLLPGR